MFQQFQLPICVLIFTFLAINYVNSILTGEKEGSVKIASFNVRHFGKKTVADAAVLSTLVKIFSRYDIVLILETRDKTGTALETLKTALMKKEKTWTYVASEPLGSTIYYKEQYVYFYKSSTVNLGRTYQVINALYERPPFVAEFSFGLKSESNFALLGIHSKPTNVPAELEELATTTIKSVAKKFSTDVGVIALGDMNADCNYMSATERNSDPLFQGGDFKSLIGDNVDTTMSDNTNCAYDRAVAYGANLDVRDAAVFDFKTAYNMDQADGLLVSDHYPIEFSLFYTYI